MDLNNLKESVKAIGWLCLGTGIASLLGMVSVIMVNVFAFQVAAGNISVTAAANTSIQTLATNSTTYILSFITLLALVAGLGSLVIVVLAMLGKVNFTQMAGFGGKGGGKAF